MYIEAYDTDSLRKLVQTLQPIYLSIQQKETGKCIKELLHNNGYTVKDIQQIMGFENPQAVYKWLAGKSLPSIDNFLILSRVLHTSIEDILVIDGDIAVLWRRRYTNEECTIYKMVLLLVGLKK